MSVISAAMAARSNFASGDRPTISSGRLLAASQSPFSAPSPSGSAPLCPPPPLPHPKQHQKLQQRQHGKQQKKEQQEKPLFNRRPRQKKQELQKH